MPIMADLLCFKGILESLRMNLEGLGGHDFKNKDSKYYKATLEKLVNRLFIKEEEDGDVEEPDQKQGAGTNLLSHKN